MFTFPYSKYGAEPAKPVYIGFNTPKPTTWAAVSATAVQLTYEDMVVSGHPNDVRVPWVSNFGNLIQMKYQWVAFPKSNPLCPVYDQVADYQTYFIEYILGGVDNPNMWDAASSLFTIDEEFDIDGEEYVFYVTNAVSFPCDFVLRNNDSD